MPVITQTPKPVNKVVAVREPVNPATPPKVSPGPFANFLVCILQLIELF